MPSSLRQRIASELAGPALPLVAFSIALNLTVGQITAALKLPVYLDSLGTILAAVLCGPWAAMIAGTIANALAATLGNPSMIFFIPVAMVIGACTAVWAKLGWFRSWYLCIAGGIIQGIVAALVSAPISAYVFGGTMMAGTDAVVIFFRSMGNNLLQSTFYQGLSSDPVDKAISYLTIYFLLRNLPERILGRFKGGHLVQTKASGTTER